MNSPAPFPRQRTRFVLPLLFLSVTVVFVLLAVGVVRFFTATSDVDALRSRLMQSSAVDWDKKIHLRVGALTLHLARAVLSFVPVPHEARTALRAVRAGEVGVYQLRGSDQRLDQAALLSAADEVMTARGWDRLVTVAQENQLVLVYVSASTRSPRDVKACVAVLDGKQLVLVSTRGNLEPLLELAAEKSLLGKNGRLLVKF